VTVKISSRSLRRRVLPCSPGVPGGKKKEKEGLAKKPSPLPVPSGFTFSFLTVPRQSTRGKEGGKARGTRGVLLFPDERGPFVPGRSPRASRLCSPPTGSSWATTRTGRKKRKGDKRRTGGGGTKCAHHRARTCSSTRPLTRYDRTSK